MKDGRTPETQSTAAKLSTSHSTFELFPDDDNAPTALWPKPGVMEGRLLARLLRGEHLTGRDWSGAVHGTRLPAEVWTLKQTGWIVHRVLLTVQTGDRTSNGVRKARIARYWLDTVQCRRMMADPRAEPFLREVDFFERRAA
ncbi:MAG: hypothetical protein RJA99_1228 [Pseudomonadota bacterium]|jgi:hypothetical protein